MWHCGKVIFVLQHQEVTDDHVDYFQEGTQALRELLHIGEKPAATEPEKKKEKDQAKPGRQLSLDELFRSQSKLCPH